MGLCPKPRRGVRALPGPHFMRVSGHAPDAASGSPCPKTVAAAGAEHDLRIETEHKKGARASRTSRRRFRFGVGPSLSRQRKPPLRRTESRVPRTARPPKLDVGSGECTHSPAGFGAEPHCLVSSPWNRCPVASESPRSTLPPLRTFKLRAHVSFDTHPLTHPPTQLRPCHCCARVLHYSMSCLPFFSTF